MTVSIINNYTAYNLLDNNAFFLVHQPATGQGQAAI